MFRPTGPRRRGPLGVLALLLVLALTAAACGGGDDGGDEGASDVTLPADEAPEDEGDPVPGGTVVMGLEAETNALVPGIGTFASPGYTVAFSLYDTFMKRTAEGEVEPYLAESLEGNESLDVWTMALRPGVQFHDGTPLNGEAVKTVYEQYLTAQGSNLAGTLRDLEEVAVIDDLTVEFRLSQGNAAFPDILTTAAGMPFSPTAAQQQGDAFGSNPVGTGPFVFESWQRDAELVVVKNENYWREGLPYLDRVVFRPIPDEDTRLASLLSGDIDAMHTLRQSIVRQGLDEDGIEVHTFLGNEGGGAIFNTAVPPVDDVRVRQALAYGIVQDDMVEVLGGTGLTPAQTQYFSPESPWYSEQVAEEWPDDDFEQAAELLDSYVSDPDRSDGKAAGEPIELVFNCPPDPSLIELSQLYQAFWEGLGASVSLNQVEQATHIQNALAGDYMINCWRMGGEEDPYIVLSNSFGPPDQQPLNFTNFHDETVAENLEILRTSTDFDTRFEAAEAIMLHFTEQVPNVWTGGTLNMVATVPEVNGVRGWTLPSGAEGDGIPEARVMWVEAWKDQ